MSPVTIETFSQSLAAAHTVCTFRDATLRVSLSKPQHQGESLSAAVLVLLERIFIFPDLTSSNPTSLSTDHPYVFPTSFLYFFIFSSLVVVFITVSSVRIATYFAQQIQTCCCLGNTLLTGQEQLSSTAMEAETIQISQVTMETVFRNMSVCILCRRHIQVKMFFFLSLHVADCLTYIESQGSLACQMCCSCNASKSCSFFKLPTLEKKSEQSDF